MADNKPNNTNTPGQGAPGQGNANQGGASSSPHPDNKPGPDGTLTGAAANTDTNTADEQKAQAEAQKKADDEAKAKREQEDKDAKGSGDKDARLAELEKREADLKKREDELADREASASDNRGGANDRTVQRQVEQSQKILDGATRKITLRYQHTNVTPAGVVKYGPAPGSRIAEEVEVPEPFADDLLRRDAEHVEYQVGLHERRENLLFAGTLSGAGK